MSSNLKDLVPKFSTLKEIGTYKGLAKIGDAVTNLIYSISKSHILKKLNARNVSRTILSMAMKNAGLRDYARHRADSHDLADTAEAFIGYVYCLGMISLDDMVSILISGMQNKSFDEEKEEIAAATEAFRALLVKIKEVLTPLFNV